MTISTLNNPSIAINGLSSTEVLERQQKGQTNAFKARVGRTYWQITRNNILNIFNIILFVLLAIVMFSRDYGTVLFAGFSVVSNSIIGTMQEINAKRKLDKLANLSAPYVKVLRDGQLTTIHHHAIVKDDVIAIEPGDRLAVDGRVIQSDSMEIDESHLTGESNAVYKSEDDELFSGSFCIAGTGFMVATNVGRNSTINKLSSIARVYKNVLTPTQQKIATIVQVTMIFLFVFGPMIVISGLTKNNEPLDIIRSAIVFTTSLVPQGLILTTTLSLTIGAVKISRHQTLIQRVNAVEALANSTVLCFDKTGTLTQNKLAVTDIIPLSDNKHSDLMYKLQSYIGNQAHQNSTAAAISNHLSNNEDSTADIITKLKEIPFNSRRKWGAIVLPDETLIMGAPERILSNGSKYLEQVEELSKQGLRVVAFSRLDKEPENETIPETAQPLALIAISDKLREDIRETLQSFREQNVSLKVISGDNMQTVQTIAKQAGMRTDLAYLGNDLKNMSDSDLETTVQESDVFARVEPDTKRRIVETLRRCGQYVAMVGDGINDVPALKEADLAIVMNDGAQISKDIADIVLLNNAMSTLPLAFAEGTEITQTLYGTTKMFLTKNLYNTLLFIFVLFMSMPFPITPIQISWAAFGTLNIPAGLMALGILRPKHISNFREDVIDYVVIAGFIGPIGMALMYLVTFHATGSDLVIARSAMTTFFILYGMMIAWHVHGIDLLKPRTMITYRRGLIVTTVLTGAAWFTASMMPTLFDFTWPPLEIMALIVSIFILCVAIVSLGLRKPGFIHHVYRLVER